MRFVDNIINNEAKKKLKEEVRKIDEIRKSQSISPIVSPRKSDGSPTRRRNDRSKRVSIGSNVDY